jgi:hypothetical protein
MRHELLPEKLGALINISATDYSLRVKLEALGFFPAHITGNVITMRRICGNDVVETGEYDRYAS